MSPESAARATHVLWIAALPRSITTARHVRRSRIHIAMAADICPRPHLGGGPRFAAGLLHRPRRRSRPSIHLICGDADAEGHHRDEPSAPCHLRVQSQRVSLYAMFLDSSEHRLSIAPSSSSGDMPSYPQTLGNRMDRSCPSPVVSPRVSSSLEGRRALLRIDHPAQTPR